ncbi:MAG: radical SAM family heme chaperone HemW [Rhodothermales bacterium]
MAGLYLHIPFCTQRCVYCDFYFVTTARSTAPFVRALEQEIRLYGHQYADQEPLETIYFGGGTPSLLPVDDIVRILKTIHASFDTSNVQEITLELNPEDGTPEYLEGILSAGVNRLSIGVQSFFDADLTFMNRAHNAAAAKEVIHSVQKAGFGTFSADLIFGLPDQPVEYWSANLEIAAGLDIPHLSTYSLTIEKGTPLHKQMARGLVSESPEAVYNDRYLFAMEFLKDRGYEHYEISSFARDGHRAVHNHRYWDHANYIGCGPSAHSFWWKGLPALRWSNVRNVKQYEALLMQHVAPLDQREQLGLDALADEHVMLRLRTGDGLDLGELESRYGVDLLVEKVQELADLEGSGLILPIRNNRVRLTDLGKTVCDSVTATLLPDS